MAGKKAELGGNGRGENENRNQLQQFGRRNTGIIISGSYSLPSVGDYEAAIWRSKKWGDLALHSSCIVKVAFSISESK